MSKYKAALQEIRGTLYGQNIELTNWHLNGTTEPFDNFAENNGWFDDLDSQDEQPTLRDEFAKSALNGLLSNPSGVIQKSPLSGTNYINGNHESVTEWAYELADAMLKERSK